MKRFILNCILIIFSSLSFLFASGQEKTDIQTPSNPYAGKTYIFNQNITLIPCKADGSNLTGQSNVTALQGTRIYVTGPYIDHADADKKYLIIRFYVWAMKIKKNQEGKFKSLLNNPDSLKNYLTSSPFDKKSDISEKRKAQTIDLLLKRKTFNFIDYAYMDYVPETTDMTVPENNKRNFKILESDFIKVCTEYKKNKNWDINFGTFTTPFKLRVAGKFAFNNNASIGTSVYFQRKFSTDWSWGIAGGLSLSSVTLDASSTNVYPDGTTAENIANASRSPIDVSSTRPAFTPSVSGLITFKNINFTIGVGADYISIPNAIATKANPEAGWIYNGRPWLGVGFGINLFSSSKPETQADPVPGQNTSKK